MKKPSPVKIPASAHDDQPLRRTDIAAGKLVPRKRGASGAVLPNKTIEGVVRKTIREELRRP